MKTYILYVICNLWLYLFPQFLVLRLSKVGGKQAGRLTVALYLAETAARTFNKKYVDIKGSHTTHSFQIKGIYKNNKKTCLETVQLMKKVFKHNSVDRLRDSVVEW